ncbi:M14 family zinc carboxypeptidase [Lacihabitans lacunae]|uniref:M14 family zinc carboxypeptidase n=1 Tax=Lacihabitans lacunae TaxID=1028214 RepID=A0ABV7YXI6_9BACT
MTALTETFFQNYEQFKNPELNHRRFKHTKVVELLNKLPFEKVSLGKSFEGREIQKVVIGNGPKKILLWSQMHGNEATATMALFDIFNFFQNTSGEFLEIKKLLESKLELHFIPMLNPDGAERFIRRTAQGIDMNRDAVALKCPESEILKNQVLTLTPEFSFNLHDQNIRYSAGASNKQATISFLATAYNEAREWNENRTKAAQVIAKMNADLQAFIPNAIGRFSDEFEPRAFGDNIQKWGSSLILIESGGYPNDTEKQFIRKLNFVAILSALESIALESYTSYSIENYSAIVQNEKYLFDLKIKNLTVEAPKGNFEIDLGVNLEEKNNSDASDFSVTSVIEDLGDLSVFWGIKEIDAEGGLLKSIEAYPSIKETYKQYGPFPLEILEGEKASFVIDKGNELILIINGRIIEK